MYKNIQHIDPNHLNDLSETRKVLVLCMNIIESQASTIANQGKQIKDLEDEINRMKGEHGNYQPKYPKLTSDLSKKKTPRKKNRKKGKKSKLVVDKTIRCPIDKSKLPADARLHRYDKLIQQDLIIKRVNILFEVPVYYSKSTRKTYRGKLPPEYEGQFGGQLKSWIQLLHHYCDVTQGRMKSLLDNLGIQMSTGTINNVLLSQSAIMKKESEDILRSGLEQVPYAQMDGTKTFEAGQAKATQVICSPYYSVYQTMSSKSRANVIGALQGKTSGAIPLRYDALGIKRLSESKVPRKDQRLLGQLLTCDKNYTLADFELILKNHAPHLLKKESHRKVLAILALNYYEQQSDFPKAQILLSDAGHEYALIAAYHGVCWIHEERHYKKMTPKLKVHQNVLSQLRGQIWDFYDKLLNFKELTVDEQNVRKQQLYEEFDEIFTQKTDYDHLNKRLEQTFSRKEKLLCILRFPSLPLHNNLAELAIRRKVRKRDISLHTISAQGTKAQDAFMSVVETAAKLGVNALDYLYDRITNKYLMPSLAQVIKLKTN